MAEENSGGGGSAFNLNSLLALFTLVGGFWLVSHKLASDRPITPAAGARDFVGDQAVEARLWEDPFKRIGKDAAEETGTSPVTSLDDLAAPYREALAGVMRLTGQP